MTTTPTITLSAILRALYSALLIVQLGIGALALDVPWSIIVPLAIAATIAFLAELTGKQVSAEAVADLHKTIVGLMAENDNLKIASQAAASAYVDLATKHPTPDAPTP